MAVVDVVVVGEDIAVRVYVVCVRYADSGIFDDGAGVVQRGRRVVCAVDRYRYILRRLSAVAVAYRDAEYFVVGLSLSERLHAVGVVVQRVCVAAVRVYYDFAVGSRYCLPYFAFSSVDFYYRVRIRRVKVRHVFRDDVAGRC